MSGQVHLSPVSPCTSYLAEIPSKVRPIHYTAPVRGCGGGQLTMVNIMALDGAAVRCSLDHCLLHPAICKVNISYLACACAQAFKVRDNPLKLGG